MADAKTLSDFVNGLPRPAVACTIAKIVGSAPQEEGVKMWVAGGETRGTLGGGEFEHRVVKDARRLLHFPEPRPLLNEYVLCKEMGQCCGGRVQVLFEPVPMRRTAHLFGAGHVGRACAQVLSGMNFDAVLIDARPEWTAREGVPDDVRIVRADPLEYFASRAWTALDAACVFTHSHDLDFELVKRLLAQPIGYIGLIGSEHKGQMFEARLEGDKRLAEAFVEKVRCPIGLPIPSKNPKAIAVAIAGELLQEWALKRKVRAGLGSPVEAFGSAPPPSAAA